VDLEYLYLATAIDAFIIYMSRSRYTGWLVGGRGGLRRDVLTAERFWRDYIDRGKTRKLARAVLLLGPDRRQRTLANFETAHTYTLTL